MKHFAFIVGLQINNAGIMLGTLVTVSFDVFCWSDKVWCDLFQDGYKNVVFD